MAKKISCLIIAFFFLFCIKNNAYSQDAVINKNKAEIMFGAGGIYHNGSELLPTYSQHAQNGFGVGGFFGGEFFTSESNSLKVIARAGDILNISDGLMSAGYFINTRMLLSHKENHRANFQTASLVGLQFYHHSMPEIPTSLIAANNLGSSIIFGGELIYHPSINQQLRLELTVGVGVSVGNLIAMAPQIGVRLDLNLDFSHRFIKKRHFFGYYLAGQLGSAVIPKDYLSKPNAVPQATNNVAADVASDRSAEINAITAKINQAFNKIEISIDYMKLKIRYFGDGYRIIYTLTKESDPQISIPYYISLNSIDESGSTTKINKIFDPKFDLNEVLNESILTTTITPYEAFLAMSLVVFNGQDLYSGLFYDKKIYNNTTENTVRYFIERNLSEQMANLLNTDYVKQKLRSVISSEDFFLIDNFTSSTFTDNAILVKNANQNIPIGEIEAVFQDYHKAKHVTPNSININGTDNAMGGLALYLNFNIGVFYGFGF